jgi:hypothetical protein
VNWAHPIAPRVGQATSETWALPGSYEAPPGIFVVSEGLRAVSSLPGLMSLNHRAPVTLRTKLAHRECKNRTFHTR